MRRDNFLIALINHSVLDLRLPLPYLGELMRKGCDDYDYYYYHYYYYYYHYYYYCYYYYYYYYYYYHHHHHPSFPLLLPAP